MNISDFPFTVEVPVAWGDMDAFGHVNNVNYLRYFETARVRFLEQGKYLSGELQEHCGPIIASITINYRKAVVYPDTLTCGVRVPEIGTTSFKMEFLMVNQQGAPVADGHAIVVHFDYSRQQKTPIPDVLRGFLQPE